VWGQALVMTDITYDFEFLENGITIKPISIGMVTDKGDRYYAIFNDMETMNRAYTNKWLTDNVLSKLPLFMDYDGDLVWDMSHADYDKVKPAYEIADDVKHFIRNQTDPKLWAYYGAYDHVCYAQLYGTMMNLPTGFPMWTHEIMQEIEREQERNPHWTPKEQSGGLHNALEDAEWNMEVLREIEGLRRASAVIGAKALPIPAYPLAHPGRVRVW